MDYTDDSVISATGQTPETVVLLHLSDLHFGNDEGDQAKKDSKEVVLSSLVKALSKLDQNWKPQIVCITGDIAYKAKESEYREAEHWIKNLLSALELSESDLVISPGNHDADRTMVHDPPIKHEQADLLFKIPIPDSLSSPFKEYSAFCERLGLSKFSYGNVESYLFGVRNLHGLTFLCLNSAWFTKNDSDKGKLWLGQPLLMHLEAQKQLRVLETSSSDTVVALLHHPFSWLHESENHQNDERKKTTEYLCCLSSILLTGHTHDNVTTPTPLFNRCWHFPGGSSFASARYFNTFRLIRVSATTLEHISYQHDPRTPNDEWSLKGAAHLVPKVFSDDHWPYVAQNQQIFAPLLSGGLAIATLTLRMPVPEAADLSSHLLDGNEKAIDSEIKRIAALMKDGKMKLAQGELTQLYVRAEGLGVSKPILARINNNLGLCFLESDMIDEALTKFEQATQFNPGNALAFANLARTHLKKEDLRNAELSIKQARALDPLGAHVVTVYSEFLIKTQQSELHSSLLKELQENNDDSVSSKLLLAQIYFDTKNFSESRRMLQDLLDSNDLPSEGKEMLACVLIAEVKQRAAPNISSIGELSAELQTYAVQAKGLLDEIIASQKLYEVRQIRFSLLINRAAVEMLLEQWDAAVSDYDKALIYDPENSEVNRARLIALIGAKRFDEVLALVNDSTEILLLFALADTLLTSRLYSQALEVLNRIKAASADENVQKVSMQLRAWKQIGKANEITAALAFLESELKTHPAALSLRAEHAYENGDQSKAIELMQEAFACSSSAPSRNLIAQNLTNLLANSARFDEAISILTGIDCTNDAVLHKQYAAILYFAGRVDKSLKIIEANFGEWTDDPQIVSIYVEILRKIGNFQKAIEISNSLTKLAPEHIGYRLTLSRLQTALGFRKEAVKTLHTIDSEQALQKSEYICPLVHQFRCLGLVDQAIELMFKARQRHFSDPDVHQAYLTIFLSLPADHQARQRPNQVDINTVVTFTQDNSLHSLLIVDDRNADLQRGEIDVKSPMAQKLLSKQIGDEVLVKDGELEKSFVRIQAIAPRYGFAFSDTLKNFSTWFPNRPDIQKTDASQIDKIHALNQQRRSRIQAILSSYYNNELTLGRLAPLLANETLPQLWLDMINTPDVHVRFCFGTIQELDLQNETVSNAETVVLELTATLTIVLLELEEVVTSTFKQLLISGTVLSEIQKAIEYETISAVSQVPEHTDIAKERRSRLELLERAQAFALTLESRSTPNLVSEEFVELGDVYGKAAISTLLVSKGNNAIVYSDDLAFRTVLREHYETSGFCSQGFLMHLKALGLISESKYSYLMAKLLAHGYWYVMVDADDLWRIFHAEGQVLTDNFKAVAKGVGLPCHIYRLVNVVVEFMTRLWLGGISFAISDEVLLELLKQVCLVYKPDYVTFVLKNAIRGKFKEMPMFSGILMMTIEKTMQKILSQRAVESP